MQNKHMVALISGALTQSENVTLVLMREWKEADPVGYTAAMKSLFTADVGVVATGATVYANERGIEAAGSYMTDGFVKGPNNTIVTVRHGRVVSVRADSEKTS